jgi:hypothetical protein
MDHQQSLQFFTSSTWEHTNMERRVARWADGSVRPRTFVINDTDSPRTMPTHPVWPACSAVRRARPGAASSRSACMRSRTGPPPRLTGGSGNGNVHLLCTESAGNVQYKAGHGPYHCPRFGNRIHPAVPHYVPTPKRQRSHHTSRDDAQVRPSWKLTTFCPQVGAPMTPSRSQGPGIMRAAELTKQQNTSTGTDRYRD